MGNVNEKDLNLSVSKKLYALYTVFGYNAKLTRSEDTLLYNYYNDLRDYTGKKKSFDLKNRLRIAEDAGASLFVGIHMNKFPQEKYSGLQTYYSPNTTESQDAAQIVQSYYKSYLMPNNIRDIKKSTDSIYILKRISLPAILVECGFISNPEECALLQQNSYQWKLSSVIFSATAEYLSGRGK